MVFLYGPTGSGKTQLLKTMCTSFKEEGLKVLHCSVHELVGNIVESIKYGVYEEYRSYLAEFDAVLIDNIWTVEKTPMTAKAVMTILSSLASKGKRGFIRTQIRCRRQNGFQFNR
jgi:chromosomal replication initiation ATPase DnaA